MKAGAPRASHVAARVHGAAEILGMAQRARKKRNNKRNAGARIGKRPFVLEVRAGCS